MTIFSVFIAFCIVLLLLTIFVFWFASIWWGIFCMIACLAIVVGMVWVVARIEQDIENRGLR